MIHVPAWVKMAIERTKATGQENPANDCEGAFKELRLRYVKVVGDNLQLRNLLALAEKAGKRQQRRRRKQRPERTYEQENEYAPGRTTDDATDDLVAIGDKLRGGDRDW
jgi:hypothetical protein